MEILVDGEGHLAAEAEHRPEGVSARAHMRDRAQIFEGRILLLEGITHRVAFSQNLDFRGLDLHGLAAADGFHQLAANRDAGSCGHLGKQFCIRGRLVYYYLYIIYGGTVVQGYERDFFVSTFSAHPALREHIFSGCLCKKVLDLRPEYFL